MARKKITLITGANGEVGHGLIDYLATQPDTLPVVTLDIRELQSSMTDKVENGIVGNILDEVLIARLDQDYEIDTIFHLAALLSTSAERKPELAHQVNTQGTINLLKLALDQAQARGEAVKFIYPSSIAAHGLPDLATKAANPRVLEDDYLNPITMYGCNKLYCENLGRYYTFYYNQLSDDAPKDRGVDFRCVRYPGLISAVTVPTGGTSDYGPEMLHAAAKGEPYAAFVRPDATLPFMVMPDAIKALCDLAAAPRENLLRLVYNVSSFSLSAEQIAAIVQRHFPEANIIYVPDRGRQRIVDSWPADIDDTAARNDWGWSPDYDLERAFSEYLVPTIKKRYE